VRANGVGIDGPSMPRRADNAMSAVAGVLRTPLRQAAQIRATQPGGSIMPIHHTTASRIAWPRSRALATALALAIAGSAAAAPALHPGLRLDSRSHGAATMSGGQRWQSARDRLLASHSTTPSGVTLLVGNCNDDGPGSLRAVIAAAASGDTVDARGLACGTISLATGAIAVGVDDLTLIGPGPAALLVTNGAKYGRVFRHEGVGALDLLGLTVSGGVVSPAATESGTDGGCIFSNGNVNLGNAFDPANAAQGVVVSDCTAVSTAAGVPARGGGVFAANGVSLASSVVTGCRAVAQDAATIASGGGVFARGPVFSMKYSEVRESRASGPNGIGGGVSAAFMGMVSVSHSTIAGNEASARAGGAYLGTSSGEEVVIDNSTISGNSSTAGEGGIIVNVLSGPTAGAIRLYSNTITANRSGAVNAVAGALLGGPVELQGTIVSANLSGGAPRDLRIDAGATGADNLIGASIGTPPSNGLVISDDPRLAPLANSGGPTRTQALLPDSPALDAGNNAMGSTADQRGAGFPRTLGARADIGAFERDPGVIFRNGFE
jgi:hypothetical protein